MRPSRFEAFIGHHFQEAGPVVSSVRRVADVPFDAGHPFGHVVVFPDGGAVQLQYTGQQAAGDDYSREERPVLTDAPMAAVPAVALPAGRIPTETVEAWIAALLINGGSREVTSVERYSPQGAGQANPYGMTIGFRSGATIYLSIVRAGALESLGRQKRFEPAKQV